MCEKEKEEAELGSGTSTDMWRVSVDQQVSIYFLIACIVRRKEPCLQEASDLPACTQWFQVSIRLC